MKYPDFLKKLFFWKKFSFRKKQSGTPVNPPPKETPSSEKPADILDFQPDAMELQDARLPLAIRLCIWIPALMVFLGILWACLAKVDVVIRAPGKLVTNESTIVMKPLERSVVKEIHVAIGDVVKKDQVLITFDPSINNADAARLIHDTEVLQAQLERLECEFSGTEFQKDENDSEKMQSAIFKQRQEYYQQRIQYYDEALRQIVASQKSKRDSLAKQKERLEAVKQLEDMYTKLQSQKVVALKELIEMQISRMEMEATVDQLGNDILELEHRHGTTVAEKNAFIQDWKKQISEDMVAVDRSLNATQKDYDKVERLIDYIELRAPCDCVVHEIAAFSPGSAVREAEAVITLIPLTGYIELEAEIRPEDIARVTKDAPARLKLAAYPFQKHGTLNGSIKNISENTITRDSQPEMPGSGSSYYRARMYVTGKLNKTPKDFRLIPGMQVECEIKTGTRRVIEYILYPLIKALDETAREP